MVTLATYAFFAAALFGRQYVQSKDPIIAKELHFDFYVPAFTVVQYFLYMGLLKVAEQLINPFGDDDEDFELNWIIDRHVKVKLHLECTMRIDICLYWIKCIFFYLFHIGNVFTGVLFGC